MSKHDKELLAIRNNPKNVRFDVIQRILQNHGFKETAPGSGSSHYTYHRGIYRVTVVKNKPVNQIYVKRVIEILDKLTEEPK